MISLDPQSPIPLFRQLYMQILQAIARGEIRDGEKLLPVRKLAIEFGINPATVQKAYDLLRADGVISTADRSGSIVHVPERPSEETIQSARDTLEALLAIALARGITPTELDSITTDILDSLTPKDNA